MNLWLVNFILCFAISMMLAGIIIPTIIKIAFKKKLFDEVDERKIHRGVVPRLGGLSFLPAFLVSVCAVLGCNMMLKSAGFELAVQQSIMQIFFLICSLMLMYIVGLADDLIGVRYSAKFFFQTAAGVLLVMSGCWIHDVYGFLGFMTWPAMAGWVTTVFLVIYVTNAINLIDGIDGLASGLSIIALSYYGWLFFSTEQYIHAFIAAATLGTLLPFFYYNVFGSPERHNKIFMGDTGSLTIGIVLSFLCIETFNIPEMDAPAHENLFVLAMAPILVPCFDVVRVFFHRVRKGCNPFLPDKCHIHHKLLALGMRQWQALIAILLSDLGFVLLNLWAASYISPSWIVACDLMLWIVANMLITKLIRIRERRIGQTLYE